MNETYTAVLLVGAIVALLYTLSKILGAFVTLGRRIGTLETEHKTNTERIGLLWNLLFTNAKVDVRQLGLITSQSPDRLDPKVAAHFDGTDFGIRLKAFYQDNGLERQSDPDATWKLYVKFLPEWEPKIMAPLKTNLSQALVLALQFCRDGEGRDAESDHR